MNVDGTRPLALSIDEVVALTGIGRSTLYKAIGAHGAGVLAPSETKRRDGKPIPALPTVKLGTRRLILHDTLMTWLTQLEAMPMAKSAKIGA